MAGKRQPTDLVIAKGRKHLSEAEIEKRRDVEVTIQSPTRPKTPQWLPEPLRKEFRAYAKQLCALNIYHDLDADVLGRYVIAHHEYLQALVWAHKSIETADAEGAQVWANITHKFFMQCRACADALGLSVSSRCRLVVPVAAPQEAPDPMFGA